MVNANIDRLLCNTRESHSKKSDHRYFKPAVGFSFNFEGVDYFNNSEWVNVMTQTGIKRLFFLQT